MRRTTTFALLALLVSGLAGCERGCLSSWLASHGGAGTGTPTRGPAPSADPAGITLSAVDCPDGMARCGDGIVHASRAYHYAEPCTGSPEQCQCPWERLGDCPHGCVVDGLELDVSRDRALVQLCAPDLAERAKLSRPSPPGAIVAGCDSGYLCDRGVVIACGQPSRAVVACVAGCVREGQTVDMDDETTPLAPDAAVAVLCRR